jgi:phosphorylcholine metabolism protein LicD
MPRALKPDVYEKLMLLLSLTVKVLEEHHVDYVLAYGSLLGSYVMHDLLPWDDDIDIFVHNNSKAKVMDIFRNTDHYGITGYHHSRSSGMIFKLFFNNSNHAGKYIWKYPFLDVLSYVEQGNNISPVETAKSGQFTIPKSSFYPFHKRPFGSMWVNAPHDPTVFFRAKYHSFSCQSGSWNHEKETYRKMMASACEKLTPYYPFVKREKLGDITAETLMFNGVAKYKVLVDEPCNTKKAMFGF